MQKHPEAAYEQEHRQDVAQPVQTDVAGERATQIGLDAEVAVCLEAARYRAIS